MFMPDLMLLGITNGDLGPDLHRTLLEEGLPIYTWVMSSWHRCHTCGDIV